MVDILLASSSGQRKKILDLVLKDDFRVVNSSYEEDNSLDLSPDALVRFHALEKARFAEEKDGVVLGGDTMGVCDGKRLFQPKDEDEARGMLQFIRGKEIEVFSALAVIFQGKEVVRSQCSTIRFANISDELIDWYIATKEPFGKAGAFTIQGFGSMFVEHLDGDHFGAVGLSLVDLRVALDELGFDLTKRIYQKLSTI